MSAAPKYESKVPPRVMEYLHAAIFWGGLGLLVYIYAGYAVVLHILSRLMPVDHSADDSHRPSVTILFSARNEEMALPEKLESLRRIDYPPDKLQILAASDASTDRTNEILANCPFLECLILDTHAGKNAALNALLPKAKGEILFYTDANTVLHPDCVKTAVRHFHDLRAGAVVGQLIFSHEKEWNPVGRGTGLYWRYENGLKRAESRLGAVLVGGGSLLLARRRFIDALDPRIANDLEIPARVGAAGYYVFFEEQCVGFEKPHASVGEELRRTSRIVARGLRGFWVLLPVMIKTPFRLWEFLSHKFLRWFTLPLALAVFICAWFLREQTFPLFVFYAGLLWLAGSLIGLGWMRRASAPRWTRPFTLLAQFLIMHAAAVWGLVRALAGQTPSTWQVPQSTREKS
ncbi:MAG: glycosyltransferase [Candidatus Omnitrophota bacterium]